jgi:hypothetical protein
MNKAYVVTSGSHDDYEINAVFSDRERSERYIEEKIQARKDKWDREQREYVAQGLQEEPEEYPVFSGAYRIEEWLVDLHDPPCSYDEPMLLPKTDDVDPRVLKRQRDEIDGQIKSVDSAMDRLDAIAESLTFGFDSVRNDLRFKKLSLLVSRLVQDGAIQAGVDPIDAIEGFALGKFAKTQGQTSIPDPESGPRLPVTDAERSAFLDAVLPEGAPWTCETTPGIPGDNKFLDRDGHPLMTRGEWYPPAVAQSVVDYGCLQAREIAHWHDGLMDHSHDYAGIVAVLRRILEKSGRPGSFSDLSDALTVEKITRDQTDEIEALKSEIKHLRESAT